MRTHARIRLVYNQKAKKLQPSDKAPIKYEVRFPNGKKHYIDSGYDVEPGQWDSGTVINHPLAGKLNKSLQDFIATIRAHEITSNDNQIPFTIERLKTLLSGGSKIESFTLWASDVIEKRLDLVKYSKYTHRRAIRYLEESGITLFSDLTVAGILNFDRFLHLKLKRQASVAILHQVVKTYIKKAILLDLMPMSANPYLKIPIARGKSRVRNRWDEHEIGIIRKFKTDDKEVQLTCDIAHFILFTGVAYKDLHALNYSLNYRKSNKGSTIEGLRMKSSEFYSIPLLPEAENLLKKYRTHESDLLFPSPSREQFNRDLVVLCKLAKVKKVTSHEIRHSAASWMIESGMSLSDVQMILGQADIRSTTIYAKLARVHLNKEIKKLK